MEEIEVEEYVRTEKGIIFVYTEEFSSDLQAQDFSLYNNGKIIKHSKNIIDLIEVGDYVNKKIVSKTDKIDNKNYIEWENGDMYSTEITNDKFIKSIVTSEQFKNIEYKI